MRPNIKYLMDLHRACTHQENYMMAALFRNILKKTDTKNNITIDISLTTHLARNKSNNHTYNISNLSNQRYFKKEFIPSQCKQKENSVKRSL